MKRAIVLLDLVGFFMFGAVFVALAGATLLALSLSGPRRFKGGPISALSFAICDLISNKYESMLEDALTGGYLTKHFYLYVDFSHRKDRFEDIQGALHFYSIAAHPAHGLYESGLRRMNSLFVELKVLMKASSLVLKNDIAFIKAHDPHLLGLNGIIIAKLFGLPCVLHLNSDFDMKYRGTGRVSSPVFIIRRIERSFESWIIRRYDSVIADRDLYRRSRSFPRECRGKYRAFGVRVDAPYYAQVNTRRDMRTAFGLKSTDRILLYVGRLHPVKYPQDAVECMSYLAERHPNVILALVGEGIMRSQLERLARDRGLEKKVLFLGSRGPEELADLYYTADLLIAPHGGVTLVEAALASKPAIAYDFDWHPEFIDHGRNGLLVPFRDTKGLAQAAASLLSDETVLRSYGKQALKKALATCGRPDSLRRERDIYQCLLSAFAENPVHGRG